MATKVLRPEAAEYSSKRICELAGHAGLMILGRLAKSHLMRRLLCSMRRNVAALPSPTG
jgi:hypothetical protein